MRKNRSITERKIRIVKKMIGQCSLREVSRRTGISFYTVWHIARGSYDKPEPLVKCEKPKAGVFNVSQYNDWILGLKWGYEN